MSEQNWCLELAFTEDPSRSFVSGFEAGQVYVLLGCGQSEVKCIVHDENIPLFERMAGIKGYDVSVKAIETDGWSEVIFIKTRPERHLYEVKP
ncbi:MAG: hypothetical protein ACR2RF_24955 [Geminicoccaceae bacterium]